VAQGIFAQVALWGPEANAITSSERYSRQGAPVTRLRLSILAAAGAVVFAAGSSAETAGGTSDFDFNYGFWKTHIRRVLRPLSGAADAVELNGTVEVRKLWDGGAIEEIEADGPKGHWEGLTMFLYNPKTRQWSTFFANSQQGVLQPPLVGEFKDGRGELAAADTLDGRSILVRSVWSPLKPDSHRYEELYSDDIGKTWHTAFLADLSRVSAEPPANAEPKGLAAHEGSHDFDFELGKWKTQTRRLLRPLTGSDEWAERNGITEISAVWGGKANLVHLNADGPTGHVEMSGLRLYNPKARQWSIHFATPKDGDLGPPLIGEFKNGRGVFYSQEEIAGRTVWIRFTVFPVSPNVAQSEQAFSDDQGKTWETNMISRYTRIGG
jgi:hypothetical protein